jgi:hypothetical protein
VVESPFAAVRLRTTAGKLLKRVEAAHNDESGEIACMIIHRNEKAGAAMVFRTVRSERFRTVRKAMFVPHTVLCT